MHEVIGRRRGAGPANKVLDCRGTVVLGRLYGGSVAAMLLSDTGHVGGELGSFDIGCCEGRTSISGRGYEDETLRCGSRGLYGRGRGRCRCHGKV